MAGRIFPMNNPKARVAVVEDDASMRRAMTRLLDASGLEIWAFERAEDFLVAGCRALDAACCVIDLHLPGVSGLELADRLPQGFWRRCIFVTAYDSEDFRSRIAAQGARYLVKPFRGDVLVNEVFGVLDAGLAGPAGTGRVA